MIKRNVYFNGVSSETLWENVYVTSCPEIPTAVQRYEQIEIPGKNGIIIQPKGTYENVTKEYVLAIGDKRDDYPKIIDNLARWLNQTPARKDNYMTLSDDFAPDYYRLAVYDSDTDVRNINTMFGTVTLKFNCRPEKFLFSGDGEVKFDDSGSIYNPGRPSKPLIRLYKYSGESTLKVNDTEISIAKNLKSGYVYIDSEAQDCYGKDGENYNSYVTLADFPELQSGENTIELSNISTAYITPRWWIL